MSDFKIADIIMFCVFSLFAVVGCVYGTIQCWQDMVAWTLIALMIPYALTISLVGATVKIIKEKNNDGTQDD